jgi:aspartate-semialdehyde dehydrogenase
VRKLKVGILGATGAVGQHLVLALEDHPWFEVSEVAASDKSAGFKYGARVNWRQAAPIPDACRNLIIKECVPELACDFVIASLSADVAKEVEYAFAQAGYPVISNSSYYRMHEAVPLVIPEINPDHIDAIPLQKSKEHFDKGYLVTNPNCTTIGLCFGLAPLDAQFGLEKVLVTTMQAISGAGYTGLHAVDIVDNIIPWISGEEAKVESEPKKILGRFDGRKISYGDFAISAQCNRVPVEDGHTICVSVALKQKPRLADLKECFRAFKGLPQEARFPTAPHNPIVVLEEDNRPQPKLDRNLGAGMTTAIGRVRACPILDYKFVILSHNLVRGAAGAALLNAELLYHKGYLRG